MHQSAAELVDFLCGGVRVGFDEFSPFLVEFSWNGRITAAMDKTQVSILADLDGVFVDVYATFLEKGLEFVWKNGSSGFSVGFRGET